MAKKEDRRKVGGKKGKDAPRVDPCVQPRVAWSDRAGFDYVLDCGEVYSAGRAMLERRFGLTPTGLRLLIQCDEGIEPVVFSAKDLGLVDSVLATTVNALVAAQRLEGPPYKKGNCYTISSNGEKVRTEALAVLSAAIQEAAETGALMGLEVQMGEFFLRKMSVALKQHFA